MPDGTNAAAQDHVRNLLTKWDSFMPSGTEPRRAIITARLLDSQARYFDDLDDDDPTRAALRIVAKENWRENLLKGLGHAFAKHPIHDLVAVHPSSAPVWALPKLMRMDGGDTMDQNWQVATKSVACEPRPLPTRLTHLPEPLMWGTYASPISEFVFEEALNLVMHSILARAMAESSSQNCWCPAGQKAVGVLGAQQLAFQASWRWPNVVVLNHGHKLDSHAQVVGLPAFPGDKMLLLWRGASPLFGSIAWVPYVFQFGIPEQVAMDEETLREYPNGLDMAIRHHVEIADPHSIVTVTLKPPVTQDGSDPAETQAPDGDEASAQVPSDGLAPGPAGDSEDEIEEDEEIEEYESEHTATEEAPSIEEEPEEEAEED